MVDIIVASWNCVSRLIDMVSSVRANSRWPWRMFVVDNASEDGAAEWLSEQPDLHVTLNEENWGFSRATNMGVEQSLRRDDSEWTVLMNNDITVPRHWDKVMLNALAKRPRVKVCSPVLMKARGRHGHDWERHRQRAVAEHGENAMVRQEWVGFSCAFVHKDAWRAYGPLLTDKEHWHFGSDKEFCRRLAGSRWRVGLYTGLAVKHWHGASRQYVQRRRTGVRASQGVVWRLADEMYMSQGRIDAVGIRERIVQARGHAPSMKEIRHTLVLWLDRLRIARKRGEDPRTHDDLD